MRLICCVSICLLTLLGSNPAYATPGDANNSGAVEILDIIITINELNGGAMVPGDADCDEDLDVDFDDIDCMRNLIVTTQEAPNFPPVLNLLSDQVVNVGSALPPTSRQFKRR